MSTTTSDFLRHLRTLTERQALGGFTDQQLLERFRSERSEACFAVLVQRHGPMVLSVCRRLLHHAQDAEDAFQATFLVLARKAASLHQPPLLSGWLHGVAHRVAVRLKAKTLRRATHEGRMVPPPLADAMEDITWRELRSVLDEELQRLPEQYRAPLVLCYLEARTQDEAARHLGWSKNTFARRINQARQMLARRLTRRGLTLPAALTAPLLIDGAVQATLPPLLATNTVRAGLAAAMGNSSSGIVSAQVAALAESGTASLLTKKASLALVLSVSLTLGIGGLVAHRAAQDRSSAEAPPAPPPSPARSASKDNRIEIKGRVLDPDGKPFAGARLLLQSGADYKEAGVSVRATTDKDGLFRFKALSADFGPQGKTTLAVAAKGYGPDWLEIAAENKEDITLRLVTDDVPIEGRLLDLEGRTIPGVRVRVVSLTRGDLDAWIKIIREYTSPIPEGTRSEILGVPASVVTGKDGRFRLTGIGRERGVRLSLRGSDIEGADLWAVTRPGPARGWRSGQDGIYGARFDWVAAPCKPIIGTVRDKATGKPVSGLHVTCINVPGATALTDQQGRYRINGIGKHDNYIVLAWGVPYLDSSRDQILDTPGLEPLLVNFEVQRGIIVTGRLIDKQTRKPVQGWVLCLPLTNNPNRKNFTLRNGLFTSYNDVVGATDRDGGFQVVALPGPGLLYVRTDDSGRYPSIRPDPELLSKVDKSHLELNRYQALVRIDPSASAQKSTTFDIILEPKRVLGGADDIKRKPLPRMGAKEKP